MLVYAIHLLNFLDIANLQIFYVILLLTQITMILAVLLTLCLILEIYLLLFWITLWGKKRKKFPI